MTNEQILFELLHDASKADKQAYKVTGKDLKQWAESLSEKEVDSLTDTGYARYLEVKNGFTNHLR